MSPATLHTFNCFLLYCHLPYNTCASSSNDATDQPLAYNTSFHLLFNQSPLPLRHENRLFFPSIWWRLYHSWQNSDEIDATQPNAAVLYRRIFETFIWSFQYVTSKNTSQFQSPTERHSTLSNTTSSSPIISRYWFYSFFCFFGLIRQSTLVNHASQTLPLDPSLFFSSSIPILTRNLQNQHHHQNRCVLATCPSKKTI